MYLRYRQFCSSLNVLSIIIKTHVRGSFDTDLHGVSWHFATASWVLSSTDLEKISVKEGIQMGFCFHPTLKNSIQSTNRLKTVSKVGDLSSTIAIVAHCFGALSQVRAIGHCMIGQERDPLLPDWLNWWVCPWFPAFEIQIFLTP